MKKKVLMFVLALALIMPISLMFTACDNNKELLDVNVSTVALTQNEFVYDGTSHSVSVNEASLPNGVRVVSLTGETSATNVGVYHADLRLEYVGKDARDYNEIPVLHLTWEIKKGDINLTTTQLAVIALEENAFVYNGAVKTVAVDQSTLPAGVMIDRLDGIVSATNAGNYTVRVYLKVADTANYNPINNYVDIDWTIGQATLVANDASAVTLEEDVLIYSGVAQTVSVDESTLGNFEVASITGNSETAVGSYTATITLTYVGADAANYTSTELVITRAWAISDTIEVSNVSEWAAAFAYTNNVDGMKIVLTDDVIVSSGYIASVDVTNDVTLNLNGHTIDVGKWSSGDGAYALFITNDATLTIIGTEENSQFYGVIDLGRSNNNNGNLVIDGGTYTAYGEQVAIHINGTCSNSNVTISNATIISENDNAIQFNGAGEFVIEDSLVSGYTAIYMKAGKLIMTDSTVVAHGAYKEPTLNTNGSNATGDAIILDTTRNYKGNMEIYLDNVSVTSNYAYALREAIVDTNASETGARKIVVSDSTFIGFNNLDELDSIEQEMFEEMLEGAYAIKLSEEFTLAVSDYFLTGEGTVYELSLRGCSFNQDVSEYANDIHYMSVYNDETGLYDVVARTVYYVSDASELAQAFEEVESEDVIELADDITLTNMITVSKNAILNLNGHIIDAGKNGNNSKSAFQVIDDATLTIYGIYDGSTIYGRLNVGKAEDNNGNLVILGGTYYVYGEQTVIHVNGECTRSSVLISNANIESESDNGIQFNGAGMFIIDSTTVTGYTGVYMKAGNLMIIDSTIVGNGEARAMSTNHNGSNPTGDAIVLDSTVNYQGNMTIYFGGETAVTSVYGYAFRESLADSTNSETRSIYVDGGVFTGNSDVGAISISTEFINAVGAYMSDPDNNPITYVYIESGSQFSSDISTVLPSGFITTTQDTNSGYYVVD